MSNLDLLRRAATMAHHSPDPSTQNGAMLIAAGGQVVADCNRFPDGVGYDDMRWERPLRYSIIEHAERNAIYRAARMGVTTLGATLVCPWAACADCARAIIQAGVTELVRLTIHPDHTHERWDNSVYVGDVMMREAGVTITDVDGPLGVELRRDGKLITL